MQLAGIHIADRKGRNGGIDGFRDAPVQGLRLISRLPLVHNSLKLAYSPSDAAHPAPDGVPLLPSGVGQGLRTEAQCCSSIQPLNRRPGNIGTRILIVIFLQREYG
jgi:hypothetical protein